MINLESHRVCNARVEYDRYAFLYGDPGILNCITCVPTLGTEIGVPTLGTEIFHFVATHR